MRKLLIVLAALGASALLANSPADAQQIAGSITKLSGSVQVRRAGSLMPAAYGMTIDVGDTLITGPDGNITVNLTDQSQIELTGNSTAAINENKLSPSGERESTRIFLSSGLIRSLVHLTAGRPPNFEVHTPNAVASARGTVFDVSYVKSAGP
jgi:hypothetical protein